VVVVVVVVVAAAAAAALVVVIPLFFFFLFFHFMCFGKIVKSDYLSLSCQPVCPSAWNNSVPTGQILIKFDIFAFFQKYVKQILVSLKFLENNR
jgi:hypothetical protein